MVIAQNIHPHHGIKFWQIVLLKTKMMTNKMKILLFKYVNVVLLYKYTKYVICTLVPLQYQLKEVVLTI